MSVKDPALPVHVKPEAADKKGIKSISSFFKKNSTPTATPTLGNQKESEGDGSPVDRKGTDKKTNGKLSTEAKGPQVTITTAKSPPPEAANTPSPPTSSRSSFYFGRRQTVSVKAEPPAPAPVMQMPLNLLEPTHKQSAASMFPVMVFMSTGEKLVLTCTLETSIADITQMLLDQVMELSTTPSVVISIMDVGANDMPVTPAHTPTTTLSHTPSIGKYLATASIPRLYASVTMPKQNMRRKDSLYGSVPPDVTVEHQQEFAAKTFNIQLQLPGGQTLHLQCKGGDTMQDVKTQIVPLSLMAHGVDLLSQMDKYTLTVPGVDRDQEGVDERMSFIEACRKKSVIPKLVLIEKPSAFTKKEKLNNKLIGSLIDKPLCWTVDELEKTTFHQKTTRLQYIRKKDRGAGWGIHANPNAPNPLPAGKKLFLTINMPLNEVIKTIVVEDNETADALIGRVFQKYYAKKLPDSSPSEFTLKAKGIAEYVYGCYPVWQYNYIRANIANKIEMQMVEKPVVDETDQDEQESSAQEFFEIKDEGIRYSHNDIQTSAHSWEHLTCLSIWELKRDFRIRISSIEGLSGRKREDGTITFGQVYVTAGLYHGGELQSKQLCSTQPIDFTTNPRWHEWLGTGMPLYNIPRATRVCITVYEKKEGGGADIPLAWVNCQLFDYKHELKTGIQELGLWLDAAANPIGTCVGNSAAGAPVLFVEFERFPLPVVFPTEPSTKSYSPAATATPRNQTNIDRVDKIVMKDPLYPLTTADKEILWAYRDYYKFNPKGLPKFLASVPYNDMLAVQEMHKFLKLWAPIKPIDALELLDARFADAKVRQHAVTFLEELSDDEFSDCLLQLIQVLKYEAYHDTALSRMLLDRALKNLRLGHSFFWFLKSEMHVSEISERYGLLLEAYLRGCGTHMTELQKQNDVLKSLVRAANLIKPKQTDRLETLLSELDKIRFPPKFQLPLNPRLEATGLVLNKCKYMDSKKLPLWLVFSNADPHAPPIYVIFKSGDDLRQDMLTLQLIQLMDKLWKQDGLDLKMSPYGCISSGDGVGMIEVVLNADTTAHIQKEAGGASAAFRSGPLANWIKNNNPTDEGFKMAVDNFVKSCAGYCVATYVLGIGDRHNDNVMLTKSGKLFHIDFGHFLGNYKTKFGIKRERAPFVFTPDFAFVMGGRDSPDFLRFIDLCCQAYNTVRKHASVFINLFAMMLSTGIPELTCVDDISYLREALLLDGNDEEARQYFTALVYESLGTVTTLVLNAVHILAHRDN